MDVMLRCIKVRKRYITLVKRCKYATDAAAAAGGTGSTGSTGSNVTTFTTQDEIELRKIEDLIPLQALLVFRQFAAYEMINEMKKEEKEKESYKDKHKIPSFGWTSNSNSSNEKNSAGVLNNGFGGKKGNSSSTGRTYNPSASSVSSWFKLNLKKSKKSKDSSLSSSSSLGGNGGVQNQKYSKSLDRSVGIDEYEDNEEDDDRLIDLIQSRLDLDPAVVDQFIFRLIITASTALRLTSESRPVALLELSMSGLTEMKADGIIVTFAVEDFHLIDECTVHPLVRYLIICPDYVPSRNQSPRAQAHPHSLPLPLSVPVPVPEKIAIRTTAKKGPINPFLPVPVPVPVSYSSTSSSQFIPVSSSLSSPVSSSAFPSYDSTSVHHNDRKVNNKALPKLLISIDSRNGKSTLRLNIRPMEATWNELCVGRLLGIFMSPDVTHSIPGLASNTANTSSSSTSSSSSSSSTFSPIIAASMNKFALEAALPIAGEMELIIEIDAPKIIIPDNCFRDNGCLLADAGYLEIRGTLA